MSHLDEKPLGGRHADQRKPGNGEHGQGKGHFAAQAAQIVQGFPVAGEHDRAADQKEQVFEEDVVDHVQHAARVTQGAARGHGQHHVAQLAHRGVDEHELDATGAQGLQRRHDDGNAAYPHDHGADGALRKAGKQPARAKPPPSSMKSLIRPRMALFSSTEEM